MGRGTVKWFSRIKGYGFITLQDSKKDVFVHSSTIKSDWDQALTEGQEVEFDIEVGPRGEQAKNVVKL